MTQRTLSMASTHWVSPLVLAATLAWAIGVGGLAGCKKFAGPETLEERIAAGKAAAGDAPAGAAGQPAGAPDATTTAEGAAAAPETPAPPQFGQEAKETMAAIAKGTRECVGDYISKMDMKKIDDGFLPVNVNQMDKACREPIELYKGRGRKLLGRHPVTDAYLEHAAGFGDAYLRMSFKLKQLGARERWKVIDAINDYRGRIVEHAGQIAEGEKAVAGWPDDAADQTEVAAKKVSPETYETRAQEFVSWLRERLPKLADAYDTYGYKPADVQEAIHFFSFRYAYAVTKRWYDVGVARFEALTCEGDAKACAKVKDALGTVQEAAAKVFADYEKGLGFYRGDYFKRLDKAVAVRDGLRKDLKEFEKVARKSGR